ncbi:MAG TPA: hypothetical protein VG028_02090 [Terriglobia bacterium]|nr:hypothetical protein [Terriglobia bacterium]
MQKTISVLAAFIMLASVCTAQDYSPSLILTPRSVDRSIPVTGSVPHETLTVPADTEAAVTMLSGLHTRISQVNDPVMARLQQAVYVDGQIALPPGSILNGRVTHVQLAGRMRHPAELGFRFESITLPSGETEPISAVLAAMDKPGLPKARLDSEGYLKGTRGFSFKVLAGGLTGIGALGIAKATLMASSAISTFVPVGGAAALGFAALWPKGNDVNVPPDTRCRIRLNYPVTVRIQW